jgi:hypothetical protein
MASRGSDRVPGVVAGAVRLAEQAWSRRDRSGEGMLIE